MKAYPSCIVAGGLLALAFFFILFGLTILNPQQIGWLLESYKYDSIQHFVGWEFFRYEPWHLPWGIIHNYGYPIPTSVVYTDSIPILSLIFKCFSTFLPQQFQYFGYWYALCLILQGIFAWALSTEITTEKIARVCITLFFITSPIMLDRIMQHQALVAHWVILAGFWLYLRPYDKQRAYYYWLGLTTITLLIHAYLAVMVFVLYLAFLYQQIVITKRLSYRRCVQLILCQGILFIVLAWLSGYFVLSFSSIKDPTSYRFLSMNLLAPFIPTSGATALLGHWSRFINTMYPVYMGQGTEGFNYLGLGMLSLLAVAIGCLIKKWPSKKNIMPWMPLIIVCLLMAIYSFSNEIYLGQRLLFSYTLPNYVSIFSDVFRASGRFFWPMYYLLMLLTVTFLSHRLKQRTFVLLLMIALCLQLTDLSDKILRMHQHAHLPEVNHNQLDTLLSQHPGEHYFHLVFLPIVHDPSREIKGFGDYIHYAARHNMSVNLGYFARQDRSQLYQMNRKLSENAFQGIFSSDTIYVILNRPIAAFFKARLGKNGRTTQIGSYTVIFPHDIE